MVALQLVAHDVHLLRDDLAGLGPEVPDGDVVLDAVAGPVVLAMAQAREVRTDSRIVLEGIVPVLTPTPPSMSARSMMAARRPSFDAAIAAFWSLIR